MSSYFIESPPVARMPHADIRTGNKHAAAAVTGEVVSHIGCDLDADVTA
jgi:hypothetical protein